MPTSKYVPKLVTSVGTQVCWHERARGVCTQVAEQGVFFLNASELGHCVELCVEEYWPLFDPRNTSRRIYIYIQMNNLKLFLTSPSYNTFETILILERQGEKKRYRYKSIEARLSSMFDSCFAACLKPYRITNVQWAPHSTAVYSRFLCNLPYRIPNVQWAPHWGSGREGGREIDRM